MNLKSSALLTAVMIAAAVNVKAQDNREAFHAAMEECIAETGVTRPERGQRPSDEDKAKVDACLEAKGIEKPQRRRASRQ